MNDRSLDAQAAPSKSAKRKWKDLGPRLISAFFMLAVTIFVVWAGGVWFAILVAAAFAWVMREWMKMITRQPLDIFGIVLMVLIAVISLTSAVVGIGGGAIAALLGLVIVLLGGARNRAWRAGGFAFFSIVVISLVAIRGDTINGFIACFFLGTTIWMTDTGAFFSGRLFGGAKLSPEISPAKTWSGAIGGLVVGSLAGTLVWIVATPSPWWIGLAVAVAVSLIGQMGDLSESAIKRHFRIKDSGGSIPGHGGLMDRLDSLTFGALLVFFVGAIHASPQLVANGLLLW